MADLRSNISKYEETIEYIQGQIIEKQYGNKMKREQNELEGQSLKEKLAIEEEESSYLDSQIDTKDLQIQTVTSDIETAKDENM